MTLFDIDKTGDDRGTPAPNQDDQQDQRMAHGTTQNQNSIDEAQADGLKFLERQVLAKQDGVNKAVYGFFGEANKFGLRVADDGVDVLTATADQLIFNSDQNIFKVVLSGTTSLVYDGNVGTFSTIAHGQSNIPIVLAYVQFPDNANFNPMAGQYVPMPVYINRTGLPAVQCVQSVDATNIYLRVHDIYAPPNQTYNFRYYVLQETAN